MDGMMFFDELTPTYRMTGGGVNISTPRFVEEHKKLLHILKYGTKEQRLNEAKEQAQELSAVMRKNLRKEKK